MQNHRSKGLPSIAYASLQFCNNLFSEVVKMKLRWVFWFAANFANSLFIAFILLSMYFRSSHTLTLIEPNEYIITIEAIFSTFIVISSAMLAGWSFLKKQ